MIPLVVCPRFKFVLTLKARTEDSCHCHQPQQISQDKIILKYNSIYSDRLS